MLEHHAARAGKSQDLKAFLEKCMDETITELKDLAEGDAGALVQKLKRMFGKLDVEAEKKDSSILFRMAAANVGCDDPEFSRRRGKWLSSLEY
jgi:hypothetical protein